VEDHAKVTVSPTLTVREEAPFALSKADTILVPLAVTT
jgi:hypothetical protein